MKTRHLDLTGIDLASVTKEQKDKIKKYGKEYLTSSQLNALSALKETIKNITPKISKKDVK